MCIVTSLGFEAKLPQMGMVLFPSSAYTIAMYSCSQILKRDKKIITVEISLFQYTKIRVYFQSGEKRGRDSPSQPGREEPCCRRALRLETK